jgi:protein involved in polysaccharide export with SLBB domain/uncharacterized protein involved in exopolysaccharide biosynthesis
LDPARIMDALLRRAIWMVLLALGTGIVVFNWAYREGRSTATARLVRIVPAAVAALTTDGKTPGTRAESPQSAVDLLQSSELANRVAQASPGVGTPEDFASHLRVVPGGEADPITVIYQGKTPGEAVRVVNAYLREAIRLSAEARTDEFREILDSLSAKLADTDRDLKESSRRLIELPADATGSASESGMLAFLDEQGELDRKLEGQRLRLGTLNLQLDRLAQEIAKQNPALAKAREDLDRALARYTEEHPKVKELRAAANAIKESIARQTSGAPSDLGIAPNSTAGALYLRVVDLQNEKITVEKQIEDLAQSSKRLQDRLRALPETEIRKAAATADYHALKTRRDLLAKSRNEIQFFVDNPEGSLRAVQWAKDEFVHASEKRRRAILLGSLAGLVAALIGAAFIVIGEIADGRIRTPRDLERATRLPVLATLGDLDTMSEAEREQWAFRTLTVIKGRLRRTGNKPLVCGFTSAGQGEGRSTWINLLAGAARRRGDRVVVITAPPANAAGPSADSAGTETPLAALEAPGDVARQLTLPDAPPVLRLALPDSTWNREWRRLWHEALQQWNRIENLVLLVDLPPASDPAAVLLSEDIPQIIWLCGRDKATTTETRSQMETLRCSKCELVGSVLNRASSPAWGRRIAHLTTAAILLLCSLLPGTTGGTANAAEAAAPAKSEPSTFLSVTSPTRLADWQKRLTLGPGDVIDVALYEQPDTLRPKLSIGPDGRLNYLEAQDVMAAGLTVDELRAKLDEILGKYHRSAQTVVLPVAYNSKRYFVLGNVARKGAFPLDRPVTLLEAVARASGFISREGLLLADMSRSFLIRKSADGTFAPLNVDFEGLFQRGDLGQNQAMAPDDYLYFPPTDLPEIYILGDVAAPGTSPYLPDMTVLKALTTRGGFAEKAYRQRILVVRGSLNSPQTFIVNAADILKAKAPDFKLEPRDILYVSRKPWSKVEELLELAVSDFMRAAIISWTGANVGPIIKKPIF